VKKQSIATILLLALAGTSAAVGQSAPVEPATGQKSLASTMDVYVFPSKGQSSSQQSEDESTCYNWAVQNTGTDPFQLQKKQQQQKQQTAEEQQQIASAGKGAGSRGAVGGAAAGALIGAVSHADVGEFAAWGAAIGLVRARRRAHEQQAQASQQVQQQSQQQAQATQQEIGNFKKAFSVCLEAKDYMVKY
jgi:hypothetical protein